MQPTENFLITYRDYEVTGNATIVRLFGRSTSGKRIIKHVHGTNPYLYIPQSTPFSEDMRVLSVEDISIPSILGEKLKKITVRKPTDIAGYNKDVTYIRDMYEDTFEADILYDNRVAIDHDLNGIVTSPTRDFINVNDISPSSVSSIPTRKFTFDIENIDTGTIDDAIAGKLKVCVITVHDSKTNTHHIFCEFTPTPEEMETARQIIHEHWKDTFYPENANPKINFVPGVDETDMFNNIFSLFQNERPDILLGYNSNGFDIPAIFNRCETLHIDYSSLSETRYINPKRSPPHIPGLNCMDVQEMYQELQTSTVMYPSLDYVSQKELGVKKLPHFSIQEMYQTDRGRLLAYNIIDVQLTVEIERKNSLVDFFNEISIESYSSFENLKGSIQVDNLYLKEAHNYLVLPTKKEMVRNKDDLRGGKVYKAIPGLHEQVIVVDYRGMYPSIMIGLNISKETKHPDGDIIAANGIRFKSSPVGITSRILSKLKIKRGLYKKREKELITKGEQERSELGKISKTTESLITQFHLKQIAIKVLMNKFFGQHGYKRFRLADVEIADAITSSGQKLSMMCKDFVDNELKITYKNKTLTLNTIYGDTDSLFVSVEDTQTPNDMYEIGNLITDKINEYINIIMLSEFNVKEHDVKIELDKIFKLLFQVPKASGEGAKKKYVGYTYEYDEKGIFTHEKEVVKGFEIVRANTSELTKNIQRHLLFNLILKAASKKEIRGWVTTLKQNFYNGNFPNTLLSTRAALKKPFAQYGNKPEINALKNARDYLKRDVSVGYVGAFYNLEESPTHLPPHDVIALEFDEKLPSGYKIDFDETFRRLIYNAIHRILLAYGMSWDFVTTGKEEKDLTNYLSQLSSDSNTDSPTNIQTHNTPDKNPPIVSSNNELSKFFDI